MSSESVCSDPRLIEIGHAMWSKDSRKMASHPWWWLQQTFSERTKRFLRWAVMLVMLSVADAGFITTWLLPGLPLLVVPIPLTVTVGAVMGRLAAPEEFSMFWQPPRLVVGASLSVVSHTNTLTHPSFSTQNLCTPLESNPIIKQYETRTHTRLA